MAYPPEQPFSPETDPALETAAAIHKFKEVSVPSETLLGFANGALTATAGGVGISLLISYMENEGTHLGKSMLANLGGKHLGAILAVTTALGAFGGVIRHSRAVKHNEATERYYAYIDQHKPAKNHAARLEADREKVNSAQLSA